MSLDRDPQLVCASEGPVHDLDQDQSLESALPKPNREGPFARKSSWEEDEEDVDEFTEEEIKDEPSKRILWAAENGKSDIVAKDLSTSPELVCSCDSDNYTPLHRAAYNNHPEVARLLISHNANVKAKTVDGWHPLHSAARWNSVETAELLIHSGADVNAQTNGGLTPLHMASSDPGSKNMLLLLLSNPFIDITLKSKIGETPKDLCERSSPYGYLFEMFDSNINNLNVSSS